MNRLPLLACLAAVGCHKDLPTTPAPTAAASATPARRGIEAGTPEWEAMLADFKADPGTKKYERSVVTFAMTVEAVTEGNKETYRVTGSGPGAKLVCTFLLPPNLQVNDRVRTLAPGDTLTYLAEPAKYTPGDPPTVTSLSGSVLSMGRGKS